MDAAPSKKTKVDTAAHPWHGEQQGQHLAGWSQHHKQEHGQHVHENYLEPCSRPCNQQQPAAHPRGVPSSQRDHSHPSCSSLLYRDPDTQPGSSCSHSPREPLELLQRLGLGDQGHEQQLLHTLQAVGQALQQVQVARADKLGADGGSGPCHTACSREDHGDADVSSTSLLPVDVLPACCNWAQPAASPEQGIRSTPEHCRNQVTAQDLTQGVTSQQQVQQEASVRGKGAAGAADSTPPPAPQPAPQPVVELPQQEPSGQQCLPSHHDLPISKTESGQELGTEVFIGGLGPSCTEEALRAALKEKGLEPSVVSVKMQLTRAQGRCKGYAFVTFNDAASAAQACRNMSEVEGLPVAAHVARGRTAEQLEMPSRRAPTPAAAHANPSPADLSQGLGHVQSAGDTVEPPPAPGSLSVRRLLHVIRRHADPQAAVAAALAVAFGTKRPAPAGGPDVAGGPSKRPALGEPGSNLPAKTPAAGGSAQYPRRNGGGASRVGAATSSGACGGSTTAAAAAAAAATACASAVDSCGEDSVSVSVSASVAASGCGAGPGAGGDGADGPASRPSTTPSHPGLAALLKPFPETRRVLAAFCHAASALNVTPLTLLNNHQNRLGWQVCYLEEAVAPTGPFNAVVRVTDPGPPPVLLATGTGHGRTKKDAKQLAAAAVLEELIPSLQQPREGRDTVSGQGQGPREGRDTSAVLGQGPREGKDTSAVQGPGQREACGTGQRQGQEHGQANPGAPRHGPGAAAAPSWPSSLGQGCGRGVALKRTLTPGNGLAARSGVGSGGLGGQGTGFDAACATAAAGVSLSRAWISSPAVRRHTSPSMERQQNQDDRHPHRPYGASGFQHGGPRGIDPAWAYPEASLLDGGDALGYHGSSKPELGPRSGAGFRSGLAHSPSPGRVSQAVLEGGTAGRLLAQPHACRAGSTDPAALTRSAALQQQQWLDCAQGSRRQRLEEPYDPMGPFHILYTASPESTCDRGKAAARAQGWKAGDEACAPRHSTPPGMRPGGPSQPLRPPSGFGSAYVGQGQGRGQQPWPTVTPWATAVCDRRWGSPAGVGAPEWAPRLSSSPSRDALSEAQGWVGPFPVHPLGSGGGYVRPAFGGTGQLPSRARFGERESAVWERDTSPLGSQKRPFSSMAAPDQALGEGGASGLVQGHQVGQQALALAGLRLASGPTPRAGAGRGGAGRGGGGGSAPSGARSVAPADPVFQLQQQLAQQRIDHNPASGLDILPANKHHQQQQQHFVACPYTSPQAAALTPGGTGQGQLPSFQAAEHQSGSRLPGSALPLQALDPSPGNTAAGPASLGEPQVSVQEVLAGVQRLLTGAGIKSPHNTLDSLCGPASGGLLSGPQSPGGLIGLGLDIAGQQPSSGESTALSNGQRAFQPGLAQGMWSPSTAPLAWGAPGEIL